VLRTGNIYDPIPVSTDEYLKIQTEQELNRESSKMAGEKIIAVAQKIMAEQYQHLLISMA